MTAAMPEPTFTMEEAQKALDKAKIRLMSCPEVVFFVSITLSMKHLWDTTIPTACTDGYTVWYNPAFWMGMDPEERAGVLLHETLHPAFMHMLRRGDRCAKRWNKAADYAINLIIIDAGFRLPKGCLLDSKYRNMTVEEIYDCLDPEDKVDPDWEDIKEPDTPQDAKDLGKHLDDVLVQATLASQAAKSAPGSIPGELARYVDSLLNPTVPWNRLLNSFMTKMAKTEYTFRKPNRRFFPQHILPSQYSQAICDIAVGTDASGSVTDDQFHHFISETAAIIKGLRPQNLFFLQFTTRLLPMQTLKNLNDLRMVEFKGRGGTKIDPLMEWARENKPSVLIVFTDGHYTEPTINPKVPVIWLVNDNPGFTAPFGKHIEYKFEKKAA
jgi:predicted metal-dependent peptidase